MCGIVGYIGRRQAMPVLMDGLNRLSYRGYDSAGIAVMDEAGAVHVRKTRGKLSNLASLLQSSPLTGCAGVGHTRWATHGEPNDLNAHPHTDLYGGIAVVHNGIIENHEALRHYLQTQGVICRSQTDSEVIAHLINLLYHGNMVQAIAQVMTMLQGSYAIGVLCDQERDTLYCARCDSPLAIGFANGEGFMASDVPAMLAHTRDVMFLEDQEIGVLTRSGIQVYNAFGQRSEQRFFHVDWDLASAEKGGYAHYMLKEIYEQPEALQRTFSPRSTPGIFEWLPLNAAEAAQISRITIVACGTALHAGMIGKALLEKMARLPAQAIAASEYRYQQPIVLPNEIVIAVTQSGETADTLAALRYARKCGARVWTICNTVGSSAAREAGEKNTFYTYAGPEIAVASTKAYVTQVELLVLIASAIAWLRGRLSSEQQQQLYDGMHKLPSLMRAVLETQPLLQRFASSWSQKKHVFFVGRGLDHAAAMEGALKLKEVSYVFCEAYAAGEMKHGPIALLAHGSLVVAVVCQPGVSQKTLSNLQEAAARGAQTAVVCPRSMCADLQQVDAVIPIPDAAEELLPILTAVPLQLLAYYMALERGCDVDQPRNLAKSVTVE